MIRTPTIKATMERRILVNYRVEPGVLASVLPPPFRPLLVGGHGVAGICLIRLSGIRPASFPASLGLSSENAAHRVAVEWDTPAGPASGVYIPRRDTSSRLTVLLGGRAFPGWHRHARFHALEGDGSYRVEMMSRDGALQLAVSAHRTEEVMADSVFGSLQEASAFFRNAPIGYAATPNRAVFDGVGLTTKAWAIAPLQLDEVRSSYFEDTERFRPGAAVPDSAFLMSNLDTTWRAQPPLVASAVSPLGADPAPVPAAR